MPNVFDQINPPKTDANGNAIIYTQPPPQQTQQPNIFETINPTKPPSKYPGIDAKGYPISGGGDPGGDTMSAQGSLDPKSTDTLLEGLPIAGGVFGGIPGAAAGSFAKQALSSNPSIGGGIADTITQGIIPAGIESALSGGVKAGVGRLLSKLPDSVLQYLPGYAKAQIAGKLASKMYPESDLVQTAAQNAADQSGKIASQIDAAKPPFTLGLKGPGLTNSVSPEEATVVAKYNSKYADNQIGSQLLTIQKQMGVSGDQPLSAVPKLMLSDVKHVENAILATGDPTIVRQIATNDLVTSHFSPSSRTFDAAGMLDEMAGTKADAYKLALGAGYKPFKELLDLGVQKGVGKPTTNLFSWQEGRKLAITGTALSFLGIPFKATESVILGADAIKKIASSPELGRLILQAAKTGSSAPESSVLMKASLAGLRGTTVYLQNSDGQKDPATIQMDAQGNPQLQYSKPLSGR